MLLQHLPYYLSFNVCLWVLIKTSSTERKHKKILLKKAGDIKKNVVKQVEFSSLAPRLRLRVKEQFLHLFILPIFSLFRNFRKKVKKKATRRRLNGIAKINSRSSGTGEGLEGGGRSDIYKHFASFTFMKNQNRISIENKRKRAKARTMKFRYLLLSKSISSSSFMYFLFKARWRWEWEMM